MYTERGAVYRLGLAPSHLNSQCTDKHKKGGRGVVNYNVAN